ncbi:MAG: FkbM family methyltransferase [Chromatiaceae bacterium]|jgi:FkbM family methyltransferase|nr:FkbM family methyltransferase [Chromatiaceae bacterium]
MSPLATLNFIARHPLTRDHKAEALLRWLRWQVGARLLGWSVAVPFVGCTRLLARPGMTGATGNIYCGLHEPEDMAFVLHCLRPGDLFVDIGANIGSYTLLASATQARVICFEPVPATFEALLDNIHLNRLAHRVDARNQAVGREAGELEMIADQDTTNQALAPGSSYAGKSVRVPLVTLDAALQGAMPKLIKIDVEGFETEVIAGATQTLAAGGLHALILELNGSGARYGFDEEQLRRDIHGLGFRACRYDPFERRLTDLGGARPSSGNTLFVREPEAVEPLLVAAPRYRVLGAEL